MQAIILAAGMGKRLGELTKNNTKCMVEVNGVTLIDRMLHQLDGKQLARIVIVIGYQGKKLMEYISTLKIHTPIVYVENAVFEKTNNIYSLFLASDYLAEQDTLLFESDLIFEDSVLDKLLEGQEGESFVLVDKYEGWMDGTCVKLMGDGRIETVVARESFRFDQIEDYYKTVNIYKFSRQFSKSFYIPFLKAWMEAMGNNEYYEQVLRVVAMLDVSGIRAKSLDGQKWYEIDDIQDLDIAASMFAGESEKTSLMQKRYGGYWRYPELLDFCYLVNPYFPTRKLSEELKSNFESLMTMYPSGMEVISLLAARNFGIRRECIVTGNGAAELIDVLMHQISGKLGVVRPTFEEYPNRYHAEDMVVFHPRTEDFSYTAEDIISYYNSNPVDNLIIINPDNPTGNYLSREETEKLICWSGDRGIRLVIDESFADFADEEGNSLFRQELLDSCPFLYVIKSISKSYGVPGLRLGVAASGDRDMIWKIKSEIPIWNINSFAEYYLQVSEKYREEYREGLVRFRRERRRMGEALSGIEGLRVFPSQANYFMLELKNGVTSGELVQKLLENNIFIKDLSEKIRKDRRQFVRVAIRDTEENDYFLNTMRLVMEGTAHKNETVPEK